jgi:hypothetical protein
MCVPSKAEYIGLNVMVSAFGELQVAPAEPLDEPDDDSDVGLELEEHAAISMPATPKATLNPTAAKSLNERMIEPSANIDGGPYPKLQAVSVAGGSVGSLESPQVDLLVTDCLHVALRESPAAAASAEGYSDAPLSVEAPASEAPASPIVPALGLRQIPPCMKVWHISAAGQGFMLSQSWKAPPVHWSEPVHDNENPLAPPIRPQHTCPPVQSEGAEHPNITPLHMTPGSWQSPVVARGLKQQCWPVAHGTPGHFPAAGRPSGFGPSGCAATTSGLPESLPPSLLGDDDDELHPIATAAPTETAKKNVVFIMKDSLHRNLLRPSH